MSDKQTIKKDDNRLFSIFTKGILKENGIFVMALGLCPALAVTASFEGALGMGVLVFIILTLTNVTISSIRHLVPDGVRIPVYIIIIATEVTMLKMFVDAYAPLLAKELGVFIALITVNCIILGRAEAFASKNNVLKSMLDGMGVAIGFTGALVLIGFVREFLGTGMIQIGQILPLPFELSLFESVGLSNYALSIFVQPPGAFLTIGILLASFMAYQQHKGVKK
jgi:Na+-translocating ferredoxin:NAD+ oxidoreductase subunit E